MTRLAWDAVGQRFYETGVDQGVLYLSSASNGVYDTGYAWSGLTTVTESPSGAESNPQYADNIKYINLLSAETFGGTVEALTYPDQFAQCDGTAIVNGGVLLGQQNRRVFGLSYRTKLGEGAVGDDYAYKLHLIYGCLAAPSDKAYTTVNDTPAPIGFSWDVSTTPVDVGTYGGTTYKPLSSLTVRSDKVAAANLTALTDALYGTAGTSPRLPLPLEVITMFSGSLTSATPTVPTFNSSTGVVTIPTVTGVTYYVDGVAVTGTYTIVGSGNSKIVKAVPNALYTFPANTDDDWQFTKA